MLNLFPPWLIAAMVAIVLAGVAVLRGERRAYDAKQRRRTAQNAAASFLAARSADAARRRIRNLTRPTPLDFYPALPSEPPHFEPIPAPPGTPEALEPVVPSSDTGDAYLEWLKPPQNSTARGDTTVTLPKLEPVLIDDDNGAAALAARISREQQAGLPIIVPEQMPGSVEARKAGCRCPVKENCGGKGYMNKDGHGVDPKTGLPKFVYAVHCPVHWPSDRHQRYLEIEAAELGEPTIVPPKQAKQKTQKKYSRDPRDVFRPVLKK